MSKSPIDDLISNTIATPVGTAPAEPLPFRTQPASADAPQFSGPSARSASDQAVGRDERIRVRHNENPSAVVDRASFELLFLAEGSVPSVLASQHLRLREDEDIILDPAAAARPAAPVSSVLRLISRGAPLEVESLPVLWREHAQAGSGAPPLCLVEGELGLTFDPRALLEGTVAYLAMLPLADDKRVADPLMLARRALDAGPALPDEGLHFASTRLHDALRSVNHELHRDIEAVVIRAATARRQYAVRTLFGGPHVVGRFNPTAKSVPLYLPASAAPHLPLTASLNARLVVEIHGAQEPREASPVSLCAVAVARALPG